MAVRNTQAGGTDWIAHESVYPEDLNDTFSNSDIIPVGIIFPWAKSLAPGTTDTLPSNFLECNGTTVNDADSILNGVTLPDLNGEERFVRGSTVSGSTGGNTSITPAHNYYHSGDVFYHIAEGYYESHSAVTTLPVYHTMVWIIKYK